MRYGVTKSKITHLLAENTTGMSCGYYYTKCGAWICPIKFIDALPAGTRMCKKCYKYYKEADDGK